MSIIERVTGGSLVQPLLIALGVSLVGNLALFGLWRINRAEAEAADAQIAAAVDANAGNVATIEALRNAVDACVGQEQHLADLAAQAADDLAKAEAERAEAARLSKLNRERIYAADPNCRAWAAAPVCRAVSDSL